MTAAEHFRAVERTWKRGMRWVVIDQRDRTIAGDMSERTARRMARLFNEDDARTLRNRDIEPLGQSGRTVEPRDG